MFIELLLIVAKHWKLLNPLMDTWMNILWHNTNSLSNKKE